MGWNKKTWLALALAIVLVLGLSVSASAAVTAVEVGALTQELTTGSGTVSTTRTVSFTGYVSGDTNSAAVASSDTSVATVSSATVTNGGTILITAVAAGTADITVKYGDGTGALTKTIAVTVKPAAIKFSVEEVRIPVDALSAGKARFQVLDAANNKPLNKGDAAYELKMELADTGSVFDNTIVFGDSTFEITAKNNVLGKAKLTATLQGTSSVTASIDALVVPADLKLKTDLVNKLYINSTDTTIYPDAYTTKVIDTLKGLEITGDVITALDVRFTQSATDVLTITAPTGIGSDWVFKANKVGKTKVTFTIGSFTFTTDEITVADATKVASFKVTKDSVELDPTKDKDTQKVDFVAGKNVYTFEVPITGIEPQTATAVTDLTATKPASITWSTSTPKVVKITKPAVDADGKVKTGEALKAEQASVEFVKTGTAKLTVKVDGVSRTFTFSVGNLKATAITAIPDMTMVKNQYKRPVVGTTPAAARTNLTYKSNKTSVATVGKTSGVIKAVKSGTAKITVTDSISKLKASFTVTVGTDISKIKYKGFALTTPWNNMTWDLVGLAGVVQSATYNGIAFGDPYMTDAEQQTWANLKAHLAEYKVGGTKAMTEDDIFAFYFNGKINSKGEIELGKTGDAIYPPEVVPIDTLLKELVDIPGTIFLVMDCDMSSLALTSKGGTELTPAQFNNMVINSVKRKSLQAKTIGTAAADAGSYKQKFKVLVATSKKSQTANYTSVTQGEGAAPTTYRSGWLTQHLIEGLNPYTIGNMPADANKNKIVTLKELYNYVNKAVKAEVTAYNKANSSAKVKQVVSVYPAKGDAFPIYARVKPTAFEIDLG